MRLHYVSASVVPSRSANAVHVAQQCDALARAGAQVTLYAKRSMADAAELSSAVSAAYGVKASAWRLVTYYSRINRADTARTAALAVSQMRHRSRPEAILSRNLYAAFVLAVMQRRPLILETHDLELGIKKRMQRAIMTRPWVTTVAISQALARHLSEHHGVAPARMVVLHDAAPPGVLPLPADQKRATLTRWVPGAGDSWDAVCAYFGHLFPGRGIEIIESMAAARPRVLFAIFGGNESDIHARSATNSLHNLRYVGHVPHAVARTAMCAADVLLMPYQTSVSVGIAKRDTARWMSPMKMFEYLASGVPIISSDLPVLREVLAHEQNAMLVTADDPAAWVSALDRLIADPKLARRLGERGHSDYLAHHTWDQRARELLKLADASPL